MTSSPSLSLSVTEVEDQGPSLKTESELSPTPSFCSIQRSVDWIGPPVLKRAIRFTQATDSNENLIQKRSHRKTQNNV